MQLVAGRAAMQSVAPELKVTVPVAPPGRPVAESVDLVP
jgi:hypothetical protein